MLHKNYLDQNSFYYLQFLRRSGVGDRHAWRSAQSTDSSRVSPNKRLHGALRIVWKKKMEMQHEPPLPEIDGQVKRDELQ